MLNINVSSANVNNNILTRIVEIQEFVASNELNSATKRLIDFVADFAIQRRHKREVINIRATFNELREEKRLGENLPKEIEAKTKRLRNQILEFVDMILDEQNVHQSTSNSVTKTNSDDSKTTNRILEKKVSIDRAKQEFLRTRRQKRPSTDIVFDGRGITKTYSKRFKFTLHPIDVQLKLGEVTAVVGENGTGKSTLLKIIAGVSKNTAGELHYPHLIMKNKTDDYSIKQQIAYIPQELPKWHGLMVDNLHFAASIRGIKGERNEEEVDFIISRLGLEEYKQATWKEISGGYKMRFALAKALIWNPKLLILDEPLANLDINTQTLFLQDLTQLAKSTSNPFSVIISSQHLHKVEVIANNIIFLKDGEAVYNGEVKFFGEASIRFDQDINNRITRTVRTRRPRCGVGGHHANVHWRR